jgi:hypothetical protein
MLTVVRKLGNWKSTSQVCVQVVFPHVMQFGCCQHKLDLYLVWFWLLLVSI